VLAFHCGFDEMAGDQALELCFQWWRRAAANILHETAAGMEGATRWWIERGR